MWLNKKPIMGLNPMDVKTLQEIEDAVKRAFEAGKGDGRYIDVSRVPLICQSILNIDSKLEDIKGDMVTQDQFWPVKTLVFGVVGLMLTGIVAALLMLVLQS